MDTILLVGNDPAILSSRAAVLKRTDCETVYATGLDAIEVQGEYKAKLVVLCHTVPDLVCLAITRRVHERWPATRVLKVLPLGQEHMDGYAASADAVTECRPECLLRTATTLLGHLPPPPVEISDWNTSMTLH